MAGRVDKRALVEQVKQWQRQGAAHKRAWDNYCMENGHQKFDPNLKDQTFLQSFLDDCTSGAVVPVEPGAWSGWVEAGIATPAAAAPAAATPAADAAAADVPVADAQAAEAPMQDYGDHSSMVEKVKEWQRKSPAHKQSWDNYCLEKGQEKFDPSTKDEAFLQTFLHGCTSGTILPGGKGAGKGGKSGKGGLITEWTGMDQDTFTWVKDVVKGMKGGGCGGMGMSPMGMSPMGMPPWGMSPWGMPPFGMPPFGMSPWGYSPW